jgi:hypothetical protein
MCIVKRDKDVTYCNKEKNREERGGGERETTEKKTKNQRFRKIIIRIRRE